jgi:hypothetical protein
MAGFFGSTPCICTNIAYQLLHVPKIEESATSADLAAYQKWKGDQNKSYFNICTEQTQMMCGLNYSIGKTV